MSKNTRIFFGVFFVFLVISFVVNLSVASLDTEDSSNLSVSSKFAKQVGLVKIEDVIYESEDIVKEITAHRKDDKTVAVLLRLDTPGGSVAPTQEIYQAIIKCAEKKPVIVSMGSAAASGGYYIASGASKIFANGGTLTGSIGVIMEFSKYYELLNKIGVSIEVMTAGKLKDAGSPFRELSDEERKYFDDLLKDAHEQFIRDIAKGRNMDYDIVKPLAEGQIFTGNQALECGLIDTIGSFEDAKNYILETFDLPKSTKFNKIEKDKGFFKKYFDVKSEIRNFLHLRKSGVYFICEQLI
ncbi:MAG: signal peptide peptidase SppA [Chitinivibrionia bacterium]|nr:signal peptide peptidase SppA [Chitinivibrionia bacterium]